MFFKSGKSFIVRFVLILILLGVAPGVGNVQASPLERDNTTVLVAVQDTDEMPMAGLNVYAFNGVTYTGFHGITDQNGQLALSLPEGSYRFRADLNGTQFWSGTANHCDTPGCTSASLTVSKPVTVTVLDTDGAPKADLNVYAFNGATYTGDSKMTNADGEAVFTLPLGSYRFRADLNGTQFWSETANHCNVPGCESANVTVSKPVTVTVLDTDGTPKFGLNVYAFNSTTYTGYGKTTNADGQAVFTLPLGSYRFRADLNGTQFWSGTSNHCDIPGCGTASVTISKPVMVTVLDTSDASKAGLNVYAFNGTTYMGYSKVTNADGQVVFTLPLGSYRFRADLNGTQFWSGTSNHCTLPGCEDAQVTVAIPIIVTIQDGGGAPKAGVNVYAFNGSTYTGYSKTTNANGQAVFTLPLGSYRFRADYLGIQYWSGSTNHCALPGCPGTLVTVGPAVAPTTTTVTLSPNPSQLGQIVTAAVTVASESGTPTGTVDISVGDTVVCGEVHLSNGAGTCNMIFNAVGTLPVVAAYHPDTTGFAPSSGTTNQGVEKADTVTAVIDTPDLSIPGGSVNIHVTVTSSFGIPTGTVVVSAGAGTCDITLSDGQGGCDMTFAEAGTVTIVADYSGDAQHLPSNGTASHEVLPVTPTPSQIPTLTPIPPTPTPTSTPTLSPTPVVGCDSIQGQFVGDSTPINIYYKTMYLGINNPNPYSVTISHILARWNFLAGRAGGDGRLWLQRIDLNGTTLWTGNVNEPHFEIPALPEIVLPGNGTTSTLTFTFNSRYAYPQGEELFIDFSTPGCEMYPIHVVNP